MIEQNNEKFKFQGIEVKLTPFFAYESNMLTIGKGNIQDWKKDYNKTGHA